MAILNVSGARIALACCRNAPEMSEAFEVHNGASISGGRSNYARTVYLSNGFLCFYVMRGGIRVVASASLNLHRHSNMLELQSGELYIPIVNILSRFI